MLKYVKKVWSMFLKNLISAQMAKAELVVNRYYII